MSLVHLAETLTVAVEPVAPGKVRGHFDYQYALGYIRKALRAGRQRKAVGNAPATVRAGRVSGQDAIEFKDENTVEDVTQSAFICLWEANKRGGIDTRTACRQALRDKRRVERKNKPIRKRCEECIYEDEACPSCVKRLTADKARWAKAGRKTSNSVEGRDTLGDIEAKPAETWADLLPDTDSTKTRTYVRGLIRWLASGSTPTDWAGYAGVDESYARKLLKKLRTMYTPSDFTDMVGATYPITGRVYGDRPSGTRSSTLSAILDLLDLQGHDSTDSPATVVLDRADETPNPFAREESVWLIRAGRTEEQEVIDLAMKVLHETVDIPTH